MSNDSTQWQTPDQPQSSEEKQAEAEILQYLSNEFDEVCQKRHAGIGQEQYGDTRFLKPEVDLYDMVLEELADVANYARYQYIKIRRLQVLTAQAGPLPVQEPQVGAHAFFPTGGQN